MRLPIAPLAAFVRYLGAEAQARYSTLNERERKLVLVAGSGVTAFLLFLILFSFSTTAGSYRSRTERKLVRLREAQDLADSYREAERSRQEVERQLSTGSVQLISY